jgi:hypothetical protein
MLAALDTDLLLEVLIPLSILFVAIAVVVFSLRWKRRQHERRVDLWRKFALANQLKLTVKPASWLKFGALQIKGHIGDVELLLETYTVRVGKSHQTWVRANSSGKGPQGRFTVQCRNLLTRLGGMFGIRGVSLDQGEFDGRFLVRCDPVELAGEVFDTEVRAHYAGLTQSPRLEYSDGSIDLNWMCGAETSEQLDDAVELHARLRGAFRRAFERGVR